MSPTTSTNLLCDEVGDSLKECIIPHIWFSVTSFEVRNKSLIPRSMSSPFFVFSYIGYFKASSNTVKNLLPIIFDNFAIRDIHVDLFLSTYHFKERGVIRMCRPRKKGTLGKGEMGVHNILFTKCRKRTYSVTDFTCPMVRIKRKIWESEFLLGKSTYWTRWVFMKWKLFLFVQEIKI